LWGLNEILQVNEIEKFGCVDAPLYIIAVII
jgi:hypothetical protein